MIYPENTKCPKSQNLQMLTHPSSTMARAVFFKMQIKYMSILYQSFKIKANKT